MIEYLQEYLSTVYGYTTEYFCCQRMFFNAKNLYPAVSGIEIFCVKKTSVDSKNILFYSRRLWISILASILSCDRILYR